MQTIRAFNKPHWRLCWLVMDDTPHVLTCLSFCSVKRVFGRVEQWVGIKTCFTSGVRISFTLEILFLTINNVLNLGLCGEFRTTLTCLQLLNSRCECHDSRDGSSSVYNNNNHKHNDLVVYYSKATHLLTWWLKIKHLSPTCSNETFYLRKPMNSYCMFHHIVYSLFLLYSVKTLK